MPMSKYDKVLRRRIVTQLADRTIALKQERQPYGGRWIVGLDGLSRSGKSTLAHHLTRCLAEHGRPACDIHMDDHIVERTKRYGTGHDAWWEYYALQWDVPWLRENLFGQLRTADHLTLPFYDDALDTHVVRTITLPDDGVILIEGIFLQRPEWREFFEDRRLPSYGGA